MTLDEFFRETPRLALAVSGGADSSYLLYEAVRHGCDVLPVYAKSVFQPAFEYRDALRLCRELSRELTVVSVDMLGDGSVSENGERRCYFCKRRLFEAIIEEAARRGFTLVADGTNASDNEAGRPGMAALRELGVVSPLRVCGITKDALRERSREAGLFSWDKPAYACLATRIEAGEPIDAEKLAAIERSEDFLMELGFSDFRVRAGGATARIEAPDGQLERLFELREMVLGELGRYFRRVTLDLKGR